MNKLKVN